MDSFPIFRDRLEKIEFMSEVSLNDISDLALPISLSSNLLPLQVYRDSESLRLNGNMPSTCMVSMLKSDLCVCPPDARLEYFIAANSLRLSIFWFGGFDPVLGGGEDLEVDILFDFLSGCLFVCEILRSYPNLTLPNEQKKHRLFCLRLFVFTNS